MYVPPSKKRSTAVRRDARILHGVRVGGMTTPRFGADFPLITRRICSLRRHRSILWRVSVVHDRRFRDMFNMIIGILVGIVAGIYFLAVRLGNRGQALEGLMQDPLYQSQVAERIALGVRVAVAGQDNSA